MSRAFWVVVWAGLLLPVGSALAMVFPERPSESNRVQSVDMGTWCANASNERLEALTSSADKIEFFCGSEGLFLKHIKDVVKCVLPDYVRPNVDPLTWHNSVCNYLPGFQGGGGYLPVYQWRKPSNTQAGYLATLNFPTNYLDVSSWLIASQAASEWNNLRLCLTNLQKTIHDSTWVNGVEKTYNRWQSGTNVCETNVIRYADGLAPGTYARSSIRVMMGFCDDWIVLPDQTHHVSCTSYSHQKVEGLSSSLAGEISFFTWVGSNPYYHYGDGGFLPGNRVRYNRWASAAKASNITYVISTEAFGYQQSPPGSFPDFPTQYDPGDFLQGNNAYYLYKSVGNDTSCRLLIDNQRFPCNCSPLREAWNQWYHGLQAEFFNQNPSPLPYAVVTWAFTYK